MQFKQTLVRLLFLLFPVAAFSQTTYLPQDARENILLERLEIKGQKDSVLNFSKTKPFSRKQIMPVIEGLFFPSTKYDSNKNNNHLSDTSFVDHRYQNLSYIDYANAVSMLVKNSEWNSLKIPGTNSRRVFLKTFYKTPANFYEVNVKDFFLAVNPVFQLAGRIHLPHIEFCIEVIAGLS